MLAPRETEEPTLYKATASAAYRLQCGLLGGDSHAQSGARATLSLLRRAVAQEPGDDPLVWNAVAQDILGELPSRDVGVGTHPRLRNGPHSWRSRSLRLISSPRGPRCMSRESASGLRSPDSAE